MAGNVFFQNFLSSCLWVFCSKPLVTNQYTKYCYVMLAYSVSSGGFQKYAIFLLSPLVVLLMQESLCICNGGRTQHNMYFWKFWLPNCCLDCSYKCFHSSTILKRNGDSKKKKKKYICNAIMGFNEYTNQMVDAWLIYFKNVISLIISLCLYLVCIL